MLRYALTLSLMLWLALEGLLFVQVGAWLGAAATLGWVVASFVLGLLLLRNEGLRMLFAIHLELQQGLLPTREVLGGLASLAGALLLMVPGVASDGLGLLLLLPPGRQALVALVLHRVNDHLPAPAGRNGPVPPSREVLEVRAQEPPEERPPG